MSVAKIMLLFFLLYILQGVKGSERFDLDNVVYVSRAHGQSKDDSCGTKALPCKALQVGVDKVTWGGLLYIDGDQTSTNPYSCESSSGKVVAKKSLHVRSYNAVAHISCPNGFWISADNGTIGMDATITGMQFKNTVLYLRNVSNVTIQDCHFLESSPAIQSVTSPVFCSLSIKRTLFKTNRGCIFFQCQFDNKKRRCSRAILKLTNVTFEENTASRESDVKGGLVFVNLTNCDCAQNAFHSTWNNVIAVRNSIINTTEDASGSAFHRKGSRWDPLVKSIYAVHACNASLTFNQVRSDYSSGLRFLGIRSRHSSVRIYKSCFHGHRIRGPGGVMYIPDGYFINVNISDSEFTNNVATVGGVIHVDGGDSKTAILTLSNVNIRKCFGAIVGCAISAGHNNKQGMANVFAVLNSVLFERCYHQDKFGFVKPHFGPLCLNGTLKTEVLISSSKFQSNLNGGAAVVSITHSPPDRYDNSMFSLQVTKSHFDQNQGGIFAPTFLIYVEKSWPVMVKKSRVVISDSVFTRNDGNAIAVVNVQDIKIHNFTCNHTLGFCYKFHNYETFTQVGLNAILLIEKSTFSNNSKSIYAEYIQPEFVNIQVRDTFFKDNNGWGQVSIVFGSIMGPIRNPHGRVLFDRVYFISNKQNEEEAENQLLLIKVPFFHDGNISFVLRQSLFKDNFENQTHRTRSRYQEKSLFLFETPEDGPSHRPSVCGHPSNSSYQSIILHRHYLMLNEVIFENNTGLSFIVYIANGRISFTKCVFKNNFSHKPKTGAHLYIQDGSASVELNNTTFTQTANYYTPLSTDVSGYVFTMLFMFAGASGPLIIRNSKFVSEDSSKRVIAQLTIQSKGDVYIDEFTELLCPLGSYMDIENGSHAFYQSGYIISITRLKFICNMCGVGKYTMERGSYKGQLSPTKCIEFCPFGAECTWNIQSRPNFWGYYSSTDPPQLNFSRCHEKYCRVPKSLNTNTSVYNACFGNRTGIMCGACKEGYTESMFNHKCHPYEECRDVWFWVIAGLYSIIMACYFLFKPPVMLYLVNNLLWFRKQKRLIRNSTRGEEESKKHDGHGNSKIIFYFYQVADLLMLESASEILHSYNLISSVISFYNFEIELIGSKLGCPFPGLTAVTKELFRSTQVFTVMAFILVFYFLHWLPSLFRTTSRPVFAPYLAAVVEVLLLGYERLGHTSLKLLNCVPIKVRGKVEWRLVLDANIVCWSNWWQYCLIAYNIIFVIPFLLVLLIGTSRLRSQRITPLQFVAACFVPLPFVTYWLIKICCRRELDETLDNTTQSVPENSSRKTLLEVLQGPFRPPDNQSRGAYYWESILIGRRLIFLCLYSFVSTPMLRMLFMTAVCFAIPVHNIIVMPYKDRKTNIFGIVMLSLHVALAIINLCKSVFITIGVTAVGPTRSQIDGLQLFEAALLGFLPCMFVILVVATFISKVFRFSVLILGMIQRCIMHFKRGSEINSGDNIYRTLSNPTEEDSMLYGDIQ